MYARGLLRELRDRPGLVVHRHLKFIKSLDIDQHVRYTDFG
jgi:hypothetical protein